MRLALRFLLAVAVLGLAAFVYFGVLPVLVIVCFISVIGIPLGFALMALPFALLAAATVWLARRAFGGRRGTVLGLVGVAAAALVPPVLANARLEARVADLVAGDGGERPSGLDARTVAIRLPDRVSWERRAVQCADFCVRALLSDRVGRILVETKADVAASPAPDASVLSYRLERRPACPDLVMPAGTTPWGRALAAEIAAGRCLIEERVPLATADVVVSSGRVARGTNAYGAGHRAFADTVSAARLTVHVRDGDAFREVHRRTGVRWEPLLPVLAPSVVPGYGLEARAGFLRREVRRNLGPYENLEPDWKGFLADALGLPPEPRLGAARGPAG